MIIRNGRHLVRIHNVKTEHVQGDVYYLKFDAGYRGFKRSCKVPTRNIRAIEAAHNHRYKRRKNILMNSHEKSIAQQLRPWCYEIDEIIQN